jgi:hypothetical protein
MPVALYGTPSMRERWPRFPKDVATRGTTSRPTKASAAPSQDHTPVLGRWAATGRTGIGVGVGTRTGAGFSALAGSLSDRIAPVGQVERHASHSRHRPCSTRATPFTTLMAPVGHTSVHNPQPVQCVSSTYTTVTIFLTCRQPIQALHRFSQLLLQHLGLFPQPAYLVLLVLAFD